MIELKSQRERLMKWNDNNYATHIHSYCPTSQPLVMTNPFTNIHCALLWKNPGSRYHFKALCTMNYTKFTRSADSFFFSVITKTEIKSSKCKKPGYLITTILRNAFDSKTVIYWIFIEKRLIFLNHRKYQYFPKVNKKVNDTRIAPKWYAAHE